MVCRLGVYCNQQRKSLISSHLKAATAAAAMYNEKKSHGKSEFSRVLADNLCVLVTTPPSSSSVPFSAHMLPIKQSNLHDVSLCIYVCVCGWEMARKSALLPRCAKKRGEMRRTGWTKKSVTTQTDDD